MRIFKNRGDIYLPSTKIKADIEHKILLILLSFLVAFTAVFLVVVGIKYDFSVKNFFAPNIETTQDNNNSVKLPSVSGKNNFLFIMSNSDTDEMYFCSVIQIDYDNIAYKVCTLDKNTVVEGKSLGDIYSTSAAGSVVNAVSTLLDIKIDYYIDESLSNYKKMFDFLGEINYLLLDDIVYKDTSTYGFNIKLSAGSQNINGDVTSKIMRYYLSEKKYGVVNDILLAALSQQINPENFNKKDKLFSSFISLSNTNITITDFTKSEDGLRLLSSETTGVNIYSVTPDYENNELSNASIDNIRGYFAKD